MRRAHDLTETHWIATGTFTIPVAVSDDGQRLVTLSGSGQFRLMDVSSGQALWQRTDSFSGTPVALFLPFPFETVCYHC